jgi:menaquinone-dependent protoporphyrinogen IX oxidase
MKTLIVYKGKYGATCQYACWLGQELQAPVMESDDAGHVSLEMYENIIIGSSVYVGKLQMKDWIKRYAKILAAKNVFFFVVCATPAHEQGKTADIIKQNIPEQLIQPNNIYFLRGRMVKKGLSLPDLFTLKLGALLQKDPAARESMLRDFDEVKRENLFPLIKAVQILKPQYCTLMPA